MEFSFSFQLWKIHLTECLIENDCYGIGKIQGTYIMSHRNTYAAFRMLRQYLFRYSGTFLSEHDEVTILILHIRIPVLTFCSCIENTCAGILNQKIIIRPLYSTFINDLLLFIITNPKKIKFCSHLFLSIN